MTVKTNADHRNAFLFALMVPAVVSLTCGGIRSVSQDERDSGTADVGMAIEDAATPVDGDGTLRDGGSHQALACRELMQLSCDQEAVSREWREGGEVFRRDGGVLSCAIEGAVCTIVALDGVNGILLRVDDEGGVGSVEDRVCTCRNGEWVCIGGVFEGSLPVLQPPPDAGGCGLEPGQTVNCNPAPGVSCVQKVDENLSSGPCVCTDAGAL